MSKRIGVVVCNLGGPDSLAAVEPFLFNLFHDPAIIALPGPARWLIAKIISKTRNSILGCTSGASADAYNLIT